LHFCVFFFAVFLVVFVAADDVRGLFFRALQETDFLREDIGDVLSGKFRELPI